MKVTEKIREAIHILKKEGKSLRGITAYLAKHHDIHISPSTVHYHLNPDYRIKTRKRTNINYHKGREVGI